MNKRFAMLRLPFSFKVASAYMLQLMHFSRSELDDLESPFNIHKLLLLNNKNLRHYTMRHNTV
ncbi:MAG: hypothetical protein LBH59_10600 [Planctomycetaceae bacterium]|nr:hypothetical protein [Planctomycetaceae bacterium]